MKIGLSSYSLSKAVQDGRLDILGVIRTVTEWGSEHMELVANLLETPEKIKPIREEAEKCGIPLSSYTFGANFITQGWAGEPITEAERKTEIERVKKQVDIAAELGIKIVRHDVGGRPPELNTLAQFEKDLPIAAEACAEVADYARQYGICTNLENHGRYFQGSERVRRLVEMVNRPNFSCFIDVGNCMGVDEDPYSAALNNIDIVTMFHFKDNYSRKFVPDPENWSCTQHGYYTKGAITGYGDIDLKRIADLITEKGFDGFISIEFECPDVDCMYGAKRSLENVRKLFGR